MNEMLSNWLPFWRRLSIKRLDFVRFGGENITDQLAPLDGGYGWFIVALAFFNNMVVDGLANAFGIYNQEELYLTTYLC